MAIYSLPASPAPDVTVISAPKYGTAPIFISSHGYQYTVTGNTLIAPDIIRRVLGNSKNPKEAVQKLDFLYKKRGYFLVAIKAQLDHHAVGLTIIEGMLSEKQVSNGLGWFFPGLENRRNLVGNDILYRSVLANAYTQRNGQQLQIGFVPASNPDGSKLIVTTSPLPKYQPFSGNVFFGNYGSRYAGRYVTGGSLSYSPGFGLMLSVNGTQGLPSLTSASKGSVYSQGGLNLSSITPMGNLWFSAGWTHYRIGQVTYPYFPTGNIFTWSLTGSQLLYASETSRLSLNESYNHVSNLVYVGQEFIPGGILLTQQRYGYLSAGLQWNHSYSIAGSAGSMSGGFTYNQGINASRGTLADNVPGQPTARFRYFDADISATQKLPGGMNLAVTANGQGAFDTLPQQQQWVLGGYGNLSAYYPAVLVGDSGYSARLQIGSPQYVFRGFTLNGNLFAELGAATSSYLAPGAPAWQSLSDVGVGLNVTSPWGTNLSVMSALPTGHNDVSSAILSQSRVDVYFVLSQNF
ncbi:MAG: ShlB/FhaC/HecB family hemolysin secretion/activation protein [Acidithiobacillus sp.]|nr:ShlB/FhaC/HecB family hemolysin secretion/activation protein [Acidithiobacillus sp.]